MFCKDPVVSPKFPADHTDKDIIRFDGRLPFLGGQHHPWRRFFSRTVEITIIVLIFSICLNNFLAATFPRQLNQMFLMIDSPIVFGCCVLFGFHSFGGAHAINLRNHSGEMAIRYSCFKSGRQASYYVEGYH